jgi:hypothetical protein
MLESLIDALFGCPHRRTTFPMRPLRRMAPARGERVHVPLPLAHAYVVCLDCGKEFAYDWAQMRIAAQIKRRPDPLTGLPMEASR